MFLFPNPKFFHNSQSSKKWQVWEMAQQITQQQGHGHDEMMSQRPDAGTLATPAVPPRAMPRTSSQTSNISGMSAEVCLHSLLWCHHVDDWIDS